MPASVLTSVVVFGRVADVRLPLLSMTAVAAAIAACDEADRGGCSGLRGGGKP